MFILGVKLYLSIHMFRMVADKLFQSLMEKNRFVCECISQSPINHVADWSSFLKAFSEEKN